MIARRRAAGGLMLALAAVLAACSGTPKPKPTPL